MTRDIPVKKIAGLVVSILFFALIIFYGLFRSRDVLLGIRLDVYDITSGQSVTERVLDLKGLSAHAVKVTVNGQTALLAEDGNWKNTVILLPGYNVITVIAVDKFDKSVSKELVVYYKAPPDPVAPIPDAKSITIQKTTEPVKGKVQ
jgi:hypothetical protein